MKPIMMILITIMIMEIVDWNYLMQVGNTPSNNTIQRITSKLIFNICFRTLFMILFIGYQKSRAGTLCQPQHFPYSMEIETEQECKTACTILGYPYLSPWNGPGDFPKCVFTDKSNRVCHFNTSPFPGRSDVNPNYAAICKCIGSSCIFDSLDS